jgi:CDP-diacylglycerol--glycerol-3-phosphate 3-phosphatidyltransferase
MNIPTWITLSRLLAVPVILASLALNTPTQRGVAAIAFLLAASTDWLDGYLARRWHQVTDLGKFLDPLVDKLLVLAPLLGLVALQQVPAWGVFLILGREFAVAGWRVHQTDVTGANLWGKVKTVVQVVAIALLVLELPGGLPCFWGAVVLTLVSGWLYLKPSLFPVTASPDPSIRVTPGQEQPPSQ